ncbi:MAG: DUF1232 domain-containing protein [Calditrichales bacterium]|nr:DUF1232 domain-containing protein [Calditrichales bacterium]
MEEKYDDFYKKTRKQISAFLEKKKFKYAEILLLAPDFFHLLVKLSMDKRIPSDKKLKFVVGIAYFIMPFDFFPEAILGPIGYMDDIAVAAFILNDYINNNSPDIVYEHWAGEGDLLASIQNILTVADNFLGKGLWDRIKKKVQS